MTDLSKLTQTIKILAQQEGFDPVGIAPAAMDSRHAAFWQTWINKGHHGDMKYLENPARDSIKKWYPEAQSVLAGAIFYKPQSAPDGATSASGRRSAPGAPGAEVSGCGRIASYAIYADYHKTIKKKLKTILAKAAAIEPKVQGKIFIDTSPVLERSYALLAGLGWIGKNTMLINKNKGSFCFIAGVALNLDLAIESAAGPSPDHCGSCTRCLQACPTQALTPYHMEATRCIAYLTIEKKNPDIAPALQDQMGDWLFGCDICQEVCPYNKKALGHADQTGHGGLTQKIVPYLNIQQAMSWNEDRFKLYFQGTPVRRARWPVFKERLQALLAKPHLTDCKILNKEGCVSG